MSIFGTMIGAGTQLALGAINNQWAEQQQGEARAENYRYGEMAAANADKRTRALYNDFYSPEALMKQYKAAGLSPSMMFGGTPGQGGTAGAQGSGAAGPGAIYTPMSMLEGAQIANINAETEKTKAETKTIEETREPTVQNLLANLANTFADTNNKEAQTQLTKFQTTYQEITNKWSDQNYEINLKVAAAQSELLANQATLVLWQSLHEKTESEIAELTKDARVKNIDLQNENLTKDLLLKNSEIKFNNNQVEVLLKDIETKSMLAHAQYLEHMAGAAAKYNQTDFLKRSEQFFDDQIGMWLSDFQKDFYKFGEEMGLKKEQLEIEYKKLEETIRHNKRMEWNVGLMALNPYM